MSKIVVNAIGSPVQLEIKKGIAKETKAEYTYLNVVIGDFESRCYFRSPLEKREVERVLAEGANAVLSED